MTTLFMLPYLQWIVLFYHKMHFPPWKQGIYDSCHTSCHTAYWHLCAAESDCVRDDDLGFTSHSASICKYISVVLFYFEVIMMVQETCLKSTCHQFYTRNPFQRTDNHSLWLLRLRCISTPQRRKNLVHVLLLSTETGSCLVQIRDCTIRTINIKLSSRPRWLRVNQAQSPTQRCAD